MDLVDDDIDAREEANDGTYTGSIHLEATVWDLLRKHGLKLDGRWRVCVFAQDVNEATPDMLPEAAENVGGSTIARGLRLTFDPSLPCPIQAQASVLVES